MTIEVRQLLIRSQVGVRTTANIPGEAAFQRELERIKAQILAECKTYLREQLKSARER
ncbi:MAG: hypothetical protein JNN03_22625 [Rubrivivax sp.]|nr:hypothetical protein [Rubrivivax sp.]